MAGESSILKKKAGAFEGIVQCGEIRVRQVMTTRKIFVLLQNLQQSFPYFAIGFGVFIQSNPAKELGLIFFLIFSIFTWFSSPVFLTQFFFDLATAWSNP
ncbi:MAG: hypothetical protein R2941_12795 [Desulfobacterales bacterium]